MLDAYFARYNFSLSKLKDTFYFQNHNRLGITTSLLSFPSPLLSHSLHYPHCKQSLPVRHFHLFPLMIESLITITIRKQCCCGRNINREKGETIWLTLERLCVCNYDFVALKGSILGSLDV